MHSSQKGRLWTCLVDQGSRKGETCVRGMPPVEGCLSPCHPQCEGCLLHAAFRLMGCLVPVSECEPQDNALSGLGGALATAAVLYAGLLSGASGAGTVYDENFSVPYQVSDRLVTPGSCWRSVSVIALTGSFTLAVVPAVRGDQRGGKM